MKKLLKRLLVLAAPIVWRKIQKRRHGGHHGHHRERHRDWPGWL